MFLSARFYHLLVRSDSSDLAAEFARFAYVLETIIVESSTIVIHFESRYKVDQLRIVIRPFELFNTVDRFCESESADGKQATVDEKFLYRLLLDRIGGCGSQRKLKVKNYLLNGLDEASLVTIICRFERFFSGANLKLRKRRRRRLRPKVTKKCSIIVSVNIFSPDDESSRGKRTDHRAVDRRTTEMNGQLGYKITLQSLQSDVGDE